jgi:nicotinamide-nucleotide amidase
MRAEIIAVGSELLTPYRLDTNSLFLTAELNSLGVRVLHKAVVGDAPEEMRVSFAHALERADIVVSSGGLGPTDDDRTRSTVAELLGRGLVIHEGTLHKIEERFRRYGRVMPEINRRQAQIIEGATVMPNPRGTAPGLWIEARGPIVILLPGVPHELRALFESEVKPRIARLGIKQRLYTRELRIVGLFESEVEQRVSPLYAQYPDTDTTILATANGIQLHPSIWSDDPAKGEARLEELVSRMALALGENLVSTRGESLEAIVGSLLIENQATISVAESCTGGLLAERLTNLAGSSAYFMGGVVCYSNQTKTSFVGVPRELIETHGAVSSEVALALADGVRKRVGTTLGLGVTGIAGPGGGTPEKPVGLVHIALSDARGPCDKVFRFPPSDRDRIRQFAALSALDMVRRYYLFPANGRR